MLLVHPPVAKPSEPPAGIALLAGALASAGVPCRVLDANLEALLWLAARPKTGADTWTTRAIKHRGAHLAALRDPAAYAAPARYNRAVRDLQRVLYAASRPLGAIVGLADHHHDRLSPVRSADLLFAAEHPEEDPFHPWFSVRLRELLEQDRPGTIGISLNYLSQALPSFAMIGWLRREFPGLRIVLGGGLVTSWMRRPGWSDPFGGLVDRLIAGPGELPLLRLLGKEGAVGRFLPEYHRFPLREYLSPGFVLPYAASSGCWWNKCSFCPERAEKNPYHAIPAEEAAADLSAIASRRDPVLIHLLDNAVSPALMQKLIDRPPGAPWYGFARVGSELADPEICMALKRSGCSMLKLGIESGDQTVLNELGKGVELGTASRVLTNLKQAGIATYVYLLFGTPPESEDEARRTLAFTVEHYDAISFLNLAVFNMPISGPEATRYETEKFFEGDLSLYTGFRHPRGWDRQKVRRFLDLEFKRHPAVSAILRNDPPVFTSNHAALFAMRRIRTERS